MNDENKMYELPTPIELFGVECDKGWYPLIEPIVKWVQKYNEEHPENERPIEFMQIKEKWGGLRIYVNYGTKELYDMIEKAETDSYDVCEICGSREDVGEKYDGWYNTWCHKCTLERVKLRNNPIKFRRNSNKKTYLIHPDGKEEDITDQWKNQNYGEECDGTNTLR